MYILEAIALGAVQGLTEFLPISSSAHLALLPQLLGWNSELMNSLTFDIALHFGTLLAVIVYFWKDVIKLVAAFICGLGNWRAWQTSEGKIAWYILLGTLPAIAAALVFRTAIETVMRQPGIIILWLIGFGLIMALAERLACKSRTIPDMKWTDALWIGVAQALALMPGVSRSGSTIAAGLFLRFKRAEAARYSFLLSLPAVLGATVFQLKELTRAALDQSILTLLLGTIVAAITGYACIKFLLAYLQTRTLYIFVFYRILLGATVIVWMVMSQK